MAGGENKIVKESSVPACAYKNICCCAKKGNTVCLQLHNCPFQPKRPLRKCFPVCTGDKVIPFATSCLKKVVTEDVLEKGEVRLDQLSEDLGSSVAEEERRIVQEIESILKSEDVKKTEMVSFAKAEETFEKKIKRVCMADLGPPKITCTCGSSTCQKCYQIKYSKKEEGKGNEICKDVLDCNCGLHYCLKCRTKKQLQDQLKRRRCKCNLPECLECKWYSICETCAAPIPAKSRYYHRRKELMETKDLFPTISEVKEQSGDGLGNLLIDTCPASLREKMGLTPLTGAGDTLWQSPSDLLEGIVCLKPPYSQKCIKALTHQGILDIGIITEKKFMNEMELEKQKALKEQKEFLEYMAEMKKQEAITETRLEEQALCQERIIEIETQWEEKLIYELQQLEEHLTAECEKLMEQQREKLEEKWHQKLEEAVHEAVERLTVQFLEDLMRQEEELNRKFALELRKAEVKYKVKIRNEKEKYGEKLKMLRHQLECKNISNLMAVLCIERRKCQAEKELVLEEFKKQFIEQHNKEKEEEIEQLADIIKEKEMQLSLREEFLKEIIRQYQKFINFALRSSPTQAEFLLSLEKMLLFELTKQVAKNDLKLIERFQPWEDDSEVISQESRKDLTALDYHGCFKELDPVPEEYESEHLPHFHYNGDLYVREDFRNLISTGQKLDSNHELWSKDVNDLITIMKGNLKMPSEDFLSCVTKSSVYFTDKKYESITSLPSKTKQADVTKRRATLKPTTNVGPINYLALQEQSQQTSLIMGAVDSLELLIKSKISITHEKPSLLEESESKTCDITYDFNNIENDEEYTPAVDQLIEKKLFANAKYKSALKEICKQFSEEPVQLKASISSSKEKSSDSKMLPTHSESNLNLATDSLILHRASFMKRTNKQKTRSKILTAHKKRNPPQTSSLDGTTEFITEIKELDPKRSVSRLTLSRDSLTIMHAKRSIEIVGGLVSQALRSSPCRSQEQIIKVDLGVNLGRKKEIQVSHIDIIHAPGTKTSEVDFRTDPEVISSSSIQSSDAPLEIYGGFSKEPKERDDFLRKPNEAKVMGDDKAKEYLQEQSEFTYKRANSLLKMFDGHPDLIRLFTAGSN